MLDVAGNMSWLTSGLGYVENFLEAADRQVENVADKTAGSDADVAEGGSKSRETGEQRYISRRERRRARKPAASPAPSGDSPLAGSGLSSDEAAFSGDGRAASDTGVAGSVGTSVSDRVEAAAAPRPTPTLAGEPDAASSRASEVVRDAEARVSDDASRAAEAVDATREPSLATATAPHPVVASTSEHAPAQPADEVGSAGPASAELSAEQAGPDGAGPSQAPAKDDGDSGADDAPPKVEGPAVAPPPSGRPPRPASSRSATPRAASPALNVPPLPSEPESPTEALAYLRRELVRRDAEVASARSEASALNAELDELDARMVAAQAKIDAQTKQEASLRRMLADAREDLKHAHREAERVAAQAAAARGSSEAVETLQADLEDARETVSRLTVEVETVRASGAQAAAALRRELRAAEARADDAAADAAAALAASQRREDELMSERAELTAALSQAQRALEEKVSAVESLGDSAGNAEAEAQLRREAAAAAEAAVMAERRHNTQLNREVKALATQLAAARSEASAAKKETDTVRREADGRIAALQAELDAAHRSGGTSKVAEMESRLKTLAERLVEKQGELDRARSERASLVQNVARERAAREAAEASLYDGGGRTSGGFGGGSDLESGGAGGVVRRRSQRQRGATPAIAKLRPIARHRQVASAVDAVDKFTMRTGWFLSHNAVARLLFLCYLLLLHMWALFILAFHTHELAHDDGHGGDGVGGAWPAAPPSGGPRARVIRPSDDQ